MRLPIIQNAAGRRSISIKSPPCHQAVKICDSILRYFVQASRRLPISCSWWKMGGLSVKWSKSWRGRCHRVSTGCPRWSLPCLTIPVTATSTRQSTTSILRLSKWWTSTLTTSRNAWTKHWNKFQLTSVIQGKGAAMYALFSYIILVKNT